MRRGLTGLLAVAAILLTGCATDSRPEVTFYSHGESVRVGPVQYCDPLARECAKPRPSAVGSLEVPPGMPLQISVPEEIARTPWQVVFRYRTSDDKQVRGRTPVLSPGEHHAYTLRLPDAAAQLEQVEVQRYASITVGSGGTQFVIGSTWVVNADEPEPTTS